MKRLVFLIVMAIICSHTSFAQTLSEKELSDLNQQVRQYDYAGPFVEGLAMVRKNNKVGFIDKTGRLAIPMVFDASDNCVSPSYSLQNVFNYGLLASSELGVIDKNGKVIVPKDSIKFILFANDGEVLIVTTNTNCHVYEKGVFVSNKYPVHNWHTNEVLKLDGRIAFDEDLEARGYERFDTDYSIGKPYCGVWENIPFVVRKKGKYGIIDRYGNELMPCTSETYYFVHHKGLTFVAQMATLTVATGEERYPIWYDVYKKGKKVQSQISTINVFKGHNFVSVLGSSQERCDNWKNENKIELPPTVKDTLMLDLNGKRIKKTPFGKNFLKHNSEGGLVLVKKDGSPVFNEEFAFFELVGPYYVLEFFNDVRPRLLNEDCDTVMANSRIVPYVSDGTLSFDDLRKYSNIETFDFPYIKNLSKQDKLATLEFHAGRLPVKPESYDKRFFSEGLVNVKIDGVWCYMDDKGKGVSK